MSTPPPSGDPAGGERPDGAWTPKTLLEWTDAFFRGKGIPTPRLDAELLLAHVLGLKRIDLYLQFDRPLLPPELARFRELVRSRAARTPVAYLLGSVGFWNLSLAIRPGCLIPGPDSEALVEAVLDAAAAVRQAGPAATALSVLEFGVGSAAIPLAVCSELRQVRWVGVERSAAALAVARENRSGHAELLAPRENALLLARGEGFSAIRPAWAPDLIVSNPPYIPTGDIAGLMPEVSQAAPRLALDGGPDGLFFLRLLVREAAARLRPGGHLLLEMGAGQASPLRELARAQGGLRWLGVRPDLTGQERVAHLQREAG